MALTLEDIKERLAQLDEITLMELLEIHSADLVEKYSHRIENMADELEEQLT